ncbi:MAG: undecaprenyl/decaprenyl-phosphate alpha-N-acetylglucosaminyl 1-phosphate transferase [Planctomycetes bacterium]|nr:undecaprenyl/decaprenyl-phosphate alpha-N-acetylglucosaminyl 1-phosphate transferase [Planctomycetota bacterium]
MQINAPEIETLLTATSIFLLGWATSFVLQFIAIQLSPKLGLLDHPEERKVHQKAIPRSGGLAIWLSMTLSILGFVFFFPDLVSVSGLKSLLFPSIAILALITLGLVDDIKPLPWWPRLLVHFGCATMVVVGIEPEKNLALVASAIFIIALIANAFNLIDNMDQQAGGVGLILVLGLIALGLGINMADEFALMGMVLPCLAGALIGFLWWNQTPARIFLGDAGSIPLGFLLAWVVVHLISIIAEEAPWRWLAFPVLFLIPLYDLCSVVSIRISQGKSPFKPDKQHLSHRLEARGFSRKRAVGIILLLQYAGTIIGLSILVVHNPLIALGLFVWIGLCVLGLAISEFRSRPA